ncbi:5-formyltetrahydrofolate cyclo-ligase [Aspergillus saccharolyticus JOP 1030-1]|uniref:5-formyltetrahydrofolate cyclo-ligase n=1 Tax=Aspergillus saccharolyticus JOP 1030-1 TaxID=1450539 RepID=A0A318ZN28_9EURO|nr:5-formyltetrahydrofolate cyclo-ligase [Aspergillus saccharolyticus JOP 1030-1]PYH48916.1 5-formyltetrahydrofolate cyclo-ligase [Aspergillus saccharolyticus JOP 1030-1]
MMAGLQVAKKDLRRRMRDALHKIPADSITNQSKAASNRLFALQEYQDARRIGVYLSMPVGELSTTTIVRDALANGKEVFVPYIHKLELSEQSRTSVMDMLLLESMEEFEALKPDNWGIPSLSEAQALSRENCFGGKGVSPQPEDATKGPYGLDLIVMPGMAFDEGFRRLGHGKGYYDHFLTRYSRESAASEPTRPKLPYLVALSLKEQMLPPTEEIPVAEHDWPVDVLIVGDDRTLVRQH